jgi:hypothetical protein
MNMRFIVRSDPIRILVVLILVLVLGLVIAWAIPSPNATSQPQWQLAKDAAPAGLMAQVIQENLQPGTAIDTGQMKIWQIQQANQNVPLYLIDTRVANAAEHPQDNPLCGVQGCLFLAYISAGSGHYQRVLSIYLNPHLPPQTTLLQPSAYSSESGLPCLMVNQLEHHKIRTTQFCFNGSIYEIIDTQLLPKVYE